MVFKIDIKNSRISGATTAIEVGNSGDVELSADNLHIVDCEKAIVQRDPPSALASLGLPPDIPSDALREILITLRALPENDYPQKEEAIRKSSLWAVVQHAANSATVLQALLTLGPAAMTGLLGII